MEPYQWEKYRRLGLNIAYYRRMQGLPQMELAEQLNIDRTHMSRIESARTGVSLDLLFAIADQLHVPVEKLFERE